MPKMCRQQPAKSGLPVRTTSPQPPSPEIPRTLRHGVCLKFVLNLSKATLGELVALGLCTAIGFPGVVLLPAGKL